MYQFIYYIKTIAALLITNSHFDNLYPVAALSIGGSLGNVLFFLVSGFLLSSKTTESFGIYMGRKLNRIYRTLWPVSIILIIVDQIEIKSGRDVLTTFLFPYNSFWFIAAILIFYVIFYYIQKYCQKRLVPILSGSVVLYFAGYFTILDLNKWVVEGDGFFKYIFYFQVMLIGYMLKEFVVRYRLHIQNQKRKLFGFVVLFLFIYLLTKVLVVESLVFRYFQFLVQLMTLLWGVSCFLLVLANEQNLLNLKEIWIGKCVYWIGSSTLEIYLCNCLFNGFAEKFVFPLNIIIALGLVFMTSCCFHFIIEQIDFYKKNRNCRYRDK